MYCLLVSRIKMNSMSMRDGWKLGGGGLCPRPVFVKYINRIPTREDRLCPPHYYLSLDFQIFLQLCYALSMSMHNFA